LGRSHGNGASELDDKYAQTPVDLTRDLPCPVLGVFGADDGAPSPEEVPRHASELDRHGKAYEFHMYPDAGHGFLYSARPAYRVSQAMDGGEKIRGFLGRPLR
jgi:carboxymethylenebutenolidase